MLTGHDRGCSAIIRKLINRAEALFMFCKGTAKGLKNKIKHSFLNPLQACIRLCGTYQPTVVSTPVRLPTYVRPISVPLRRIYRLFQSAITAATSNTYPTLPQLKKGGSKTFASARYHSKTTSLRLLFHNVFLAVDDVDAFLHLLNPLSCKVVDGSVAFSLISRDVADTCCQGVEFVTLANLIFAFIDSQLTINNNFVANLYLIFGRKFVTVEIISSVHFERIKTCCVVANNISGVSVLQ